MIIPIQNARNKNAANEKDKKWQFIYLSKLVDIFEKLDNTRSPLTFLQKG